MPQFATKIRARLAPHFEEPRVTAGPWVAGTPAEAVASTPGAETAAVSCRGITKAFGTGDMQVQALRGIDLQVHPGELLMLVGPSGCGKTTLISVIAGILDADAGECILFGQNLQHLSQDQRVVYRGQNVKAGDPLFKLDDREQRADLLIKRADLIKARAAVTEARASLKDYQAQYNLVRRAQDSRAVSLDDVQKRRYAELLARAKLKSAQAAVVAAAANLHATQTTLARLTVRTPINGEVLQVNIRPGEYAQTGVLSTPLMRLGNLHRLHLRVDIDEEDAWRFKPGTLAVAFLRGNSNLKTRLKFVRVEPYVTPKKNLTGSSTERVDTRVLQVIYSFAPHSLPVYVGQQMDVFIQTPPESAYRAQNAALVTAGGWE